MELRYKIKEISSEGLPVTEAIPAELVGEALSGVDCDLGHCTARIEARLCEVEGQIYLHGLLNVDLSMPCSRCLQVARVALKAPLTIVYVRDAKADDDSNEELEDVDYAEHDGKVIDLRPMLREQLILAVPLAPLCKQSCQGLCPTCGEDRNLTDCHHTGEAPESVSELRFSVLKSIKLG